MCVPGCREAVERALSRRRFLTTIGAAGAAAAAFEALPAPAQAVPPRPKILRMRRVVDLTHTLDEHFPTWDGKPGIALHKTASIENGGFNIFEWSLAEHSGTHVDAPLHTAIGGHSVEQIPASQLVLPLAVVDVSSKAETESDYRVTPYDILEWERVHGRLRRGSCVAMYSGWARHIGTPRFRGIDDKGVMHFPGFHHETAEMLARDRDCLAIAVDTLSLDHGPSKNFRVHKLWLGSGRYGIEAVANLHDVPARGATIVVGAPKVAGATGGPCRLIALV